MTLQQLYDRIGEMLETSPELADSQVLYEEAEWFSSVEDVQADADGDIIIRDVATQ